MAEVAVADCRCFPSCSSSFLPVCCWAASSRISLAAANRRLAPRRAARRKRKRRLRSRRPHRPRVRSARRTKRRPLRRPRQVHLRRHDRALRRAPLRRGRPSRHQRKRRRQNPARLFTSRRRRSTRRTRRRQARRPRRRRRCLPLQQRPHRTTLPITRTKPPESYDRIWARWRAATARRQRPTWRTDYRARTSWIRHRAFSRSARRRPAINTK